MLSYSLVPSLPAASAAELTGLLDALSPILTEFQVDFVDGQFAPHRSWPCNEPDLRAALALLKPYAAAIALEADLMVKQPEQYLPALIAVPFQSVIFHVGSTDDINSCLEAARAAGLRAGVSATADVPVATVAAAVAEADFVQLMGIAAVGQQGQPFDTRVLANIRILRDQFPDLTIAVDGAVNRVTIPQLYAAGANRFAPGSAIARATNPTIAYQELAALIGI